MVYSSADREQALQVYAETRSGYKAAAAVGASHETVYGWLQAAGITLQTTGRRVARTDAEIARLVRRYRSNDPIHTICREEHIDAMHLQRLAREAGVPRRTNLRTCAVAKSRGLLTWEQIMAPGPGDWSLADRVEKSEAWNAQLAVNPSGFPRATVMA